MEGFGFPLYIGDYGIYCQPCDIWVCLKIGDWRPAIFRHIRKNRFQECNKRHTLWALNRFRGFYTGKVRQYMFWKVQLPFLGGLRQLEAHRKCIVLWNFSYIYIYKYVYIYTHARVLFQRILITMSALWRIRVQPSLSICGICRMGPTSDEYAGL